MDIGENTGNLWIYMSSHCCDNHHHHVSDYDMQALTPSPENFNDDLPNLLLKATVWMSNYISQKHETYSSPKRRLF